MIGFDFDGAVRHTFNYCSILPSGRSKRTCTLSKTSSFSVTRQTVFGHFFSHTVFYRNGPGAVKSVSELGKRFFGIGKKVWPALFWSFQLKFIFWKKRFSDFFGSRNFSKVTKCIGYVVSVDFGSIFGWKPDAKATKCIEYVVSVDFGSIFGWKVTTKIKEFRVVKWIEQNQYFWLIIKILW